MELKKSILNSAIISYILIAVIRIKDMNEKYEVLDQFRKSYSELLKVFPYIHLRGRSIVII